MRSPEPVTPAEAMRVWSSMKNPSARSVAKALSQAGRRVHHGTISRWFAQGWRPVCISRIRLKVPVTHSISPPACLRVTLRPE